MQTKTAPPRSIPRWSGNLRKCLAEDVDEDTSSDGGADNTGTLDLSVEKGRIRQTFLQDAVCFFTIIGQNGLSVLPFSLASF